MKNLYPKITILLIVFLAALILFTGCRSKQDQNQDPSGQRQSAESHQQHGGPGNKSGEIPEELEKMEKDLDEIIKALDGPTASSEDDKKEEKGKEGQKEDMSGSENKQNKEESTDNSSDTKSKEKSEEEDSEDSSENTGKEKQSEESGDKEQSNQEEQKKEGSQPKEEKSQKQQTDKQTQQPARQDPWEKVTPAINRLHTAWNSFEPKAAKNEAGQDKLSAFSSALNDLTNSVFSKDKDSALVNANKCYGEITELYSIYKKPNISEVKKLNYYTRNAVLGSMKNDWKKADENIEHLDTVWDLLKNNLKDNHKEEVDTIDFSILELKKVIKEKNQNLTDIKGRLVLTNVEKISNKLKEDSEQNQQQPSGE